MSRKEITHSTPDRPGAGSAIADALGYLNFSGGKFVPSFHAALNRLQSGPAGLLRADELHRVLLGHLQELRQSSPTFRESAQAEQVLRLVFDCLLPAYRRFHADLLFQLPPVAFEDPFLLGRMCEAVLAQGGPWQEEERIVAGAIAQLNDFIGFRPVAVLENGRLAQPYAHERFRPVPIYLAEVGASGGPYRELIEHTIAFFRETPKSILLESHFDLDRMEELAVDVRAHDHNHPVNKRTNYMFGEWDPHQIDSRGYYRRFIIRKIILDALLLWMEDHRKTAREELLYDASAVLCGTMLMASSISGSGPDTHDSSVTLSTLLPRVARQRDTFYARLLEEASGARAKRLKREARVTQQPFGHVRQYLNIHLANYGAKQVQYRNLAQLYARMGFATASRYQAAIIPAASTRIECEIHWRLSAAELHLNRGELEPVLPLLLEVEDLLHRGIDCGAIVDPWNVLGFQGLFPLFSSREDSVVDQRVESLYDMMEGIFQIYSQALGEAGAQGNGAKKEEFSANFLRVAEEWDRYATTAVSDLPPISGQESWESATHVAAALAEWRAAGEAAGDISFWRNIVERFQSAKAYAQVVDALIQKQDHIAAMGLLMQWLSEVPNVGLESGQHSMHSLLLRWMKLVTEGVDTPEGMEARWPTVRRLFDYLEANADEYWSVPVLERELGKAQPPAEESSAPEDEADDGDSWGDDEDEIYQAAYDDMVFRDSARDGQIGDTLDSGQNPASTEFELLHRRLEPRLRFVNTLAQLWQQASLVVAANPGGDEAGSGRLDERRSVIRAWIEHVRRLQRDLQRLLEALWKYEIGALVGDVDANMEYDAELQTKFDLLHAVIAVQTACDTAERCLTCAFPGQFEQDTDKTDAAILDIYRAIFRRDAGAVRQLLPELLSQLARKPLLYVPFENGGHPDQIRDARCMQVVIRFLLTQLPRLGLLRETWHLLKTAQRMERVSRPHGQAVTEFDRLFRTALRGCLQALLTASTKWKGGRFDDEERIEIVSEVVEHFLSLWLSHSDGMRLSSIEALEPASVWPEIRDFIKEYGGELLHARLLTLGNIRAILHVGVSEYLDYLAENQDPLTPLRLLEDLDDGQIDREDVVQNLKLIYNCVVDKFDRFLEYNTTTTQSDYGEMFYCLLDFLRVEAAYDRDAWNFEPISLTHEVLCEPGFEEAAEIWEDIFFERTGERAERHLNLLAQLEKKHGMRMPTITDHLNERFVKPLAVNRMQALIPQAIEDARRGTVESPAFEKLQTAINLYMLDSAGSGIDVPNWLRTLARAVSKAESPDDLEREPTEMELPLPLVGIDLAELRRQLKSWTRALPRPRKKK